MTRDQIEKLPPDRLTALLAERVMGWTRMSPQHFWIRADGVRTDAPFDPCVFRDDLAELLLAVRCGIQQETIFEILAEKWPMEGDHYSVWLLTCAPVIICRAVAVACCGSDA